MLRSLVTRVNETAPSGVTDVERTLCDRVASLFGASREELARGLIVIWLHGEHDASTANQLLSAIWRAVSIDGTGVMLNPSDVTFMGAATIGAIVTAKDLLRLGLSPLRSERRCSRR